MKYIDEIRWIRSNYKVTILAHSSIDIILGNPYIPNGCIGILDPFKINEQYGIYGTRKILNAGDHAITITLENRTNEMVPFETGRVLAELIIINLDKTLEDAAAAAAAVAAVARAKSVPRLNVDCVIKSCRDLLNK